MSSHRVARGVLAAGTALSFAVLAAPAAQAAQPAPEAQAAGARFTVDGARIRTGPSVHDGVAGIGYPGHQVTAHCYTAPQPQSVWYHLTDHTTGVSGWSEQSVVFAEGTVPAC